MARVQNTLIGRASGSVGEVVFLTWRLINVTRSKPVSVANPNTILQQQQRNRFGGTVELYRVLKEFLAVGLKNRNRKMTLFNFFQRLNQQNCFANVGDGTVTFLPENLKISYGLMAPTDFVINSIFIPTNYITLNWSDILYSGQSSTDKAYAVVFNFTQDIVTKSFGITARGASLVTIPLGYFVQSSDALAAYLFFENPLTKEVSDTVVFLRNVTS